MAGVLALGLSVFQIVLALGITGAPDFSSLADSWPFVLGGILLIAALLLLGRARFWIRESKRPFRYTYSVGDFEPLTKLRDDSFLVWLKEDLIEKLAVRIDRLARLDEVYTEASDGVHHDTHIHVTGSIGARRGSDGVWLIEILPWIRIGPPDTPATLAHPVKFRFEDYSGALPPQLSADSYEKLAERTYFNVATALYKRIREDVERKISLLPGRYLRAVAYFHEAQDYANSNTLDAYEAAEELYDSVLKLYDPNRYAPAQSRWRKFRWILACQLGKILHWIRLKSSAVSRRAGRVELLVARAYIGYSNTLLYRRLLAGFSGGRLNPVFETRDATLTAVTRLEALSPDVPGQPAALFDAYVTRALALSQLDSPAEAKRMQRLATTLDPRRAETDPAYLMVAGDLEPRILQSIELYRRAVEVQDKFETAQFSLAQETEMLWRTRPELEKTVADMVFGEYEAVIKLNPGNIAAWANLGYMRWLLGDSKRAAQAFRRARDYKEVKRETFVSELDYGLARIAAEDGDFEKAYKSYINAVAAQLAQGVAYGGYTGYYFASLTEALVGRFDKYEASVAEHWRQPRAEQLENTTKRVRDSVYAFVLNDCAEAYFNFYLRSGDEEHLDEALAKLRLAADELNTRYVMVYVNLHRLTSYHSSLGTSDAERFVQKIAELAPTWTDGTFTQVDYEISRMRDAKDDADRARSEAAEADSYAGDLRRQAETRRGRSRQQRELARQERSTSSSLNQPARQETAPGQPREGHWEYVPPDGAETAEELRMPDSAESGEASRVSLGGTDSARRAEDRATALVAAAVELESQAGELEDTASKRKAAAKEFEAEALERARKARANLEPLLAHGALWREPRSGGERRFNWELFTRPEVFQDYRWERELSDLDVRALGAWCETCLALQGADEQARKLAEYIRRRFREDDVDFLIALVKHEPPDTKDGDKLRRRLAGRIEFWLEREATWWGSEWVIDEYFSPERMVDHLRTLALRPDLPSHLAVTLWVKLGDLLFARGEWEECTKAYQEARAQDGEREQPVNPAAFYSRVIGRSVWRTGTPQDAVGAFGIGIEDLGEEGTHEAIVRDLVETGAVDSAEGYFWLRDWLEDEGVAARMANDAERLARYESGRRALAQAYVSAVRRSRSPYGVDREPYVDVLALGVDYDAMEAREPDLWSRLVEDGLREIQMTIGESSGFTPPAPTLSLASDLDGDLYSILVHGVPVDRGPPPVDSGDLYGGIVSHVSRVVVRQLDSFADAPTVESLCLSWAGDRADRMALCEEALPDAGSLLRLVEVVRALLREQVPIHDLGAILAAFTAERDGTPDIHELVENVRRPLVDTISSASRNRRPVAFPSEVLAAVDAGIRADNGDRFLVMPIPDAYEAHRAIEQSLGAAPARDCVAVVPNPSLRPFARELVAECCPELLVLTRDELAEQSRPGSHGGTP